MNICFENFMYRMLYIFLLIFFFNSCDEKTINFIPGPDDGLDFKNESLNLSISESSFTAIPQYINQDLGPLLYAGSIMESGEMSSVLFQINSEILKDFELCIDDEQIKNKGDIKFRSVLYDGDWDSEDLTLYYYNGDNIDFFEDSENNHNSSKIQNITEIIKQQQQLLTFELSEIEDSQGTRHFLTSTLLDVDECTFEINEENCINSLYNDCIWNGSECSASNDDILELINWEDLCNTTNSLNYFYILLEYSSSDDFINLYSSDIPSEAGYSAMNVPSLMVYYETEIEEEVLNSRFNISDISYSQSLDISNVFYTDDLYNWKFNCNDITDPESCQEYEYCMYQENNGENNGDCIWSNIVGNNHNIIIANKNSALNNFGTLYGLQIDNSNEVIYQGTSSSDPVTFTIDIDLNPDIPSDSLIFSFTKASFNYNNDNINQVYDDNNEILYDTGSDECYDEYESGDIKIDSQECPDPYSFSEEHGCYFDYNNDGHYKLCVDSVTLSGYKEDDNGFENNEKFDCDDLDEDGHCDEGGNTEYWEDLGLDSADDDYETGCRQSGYNHGVGYIGDIDETYMDLTGGDVNFYEKEYLLKDGTTVKLCGQEFWDNPDGVQGCRVCSKDDPNGDNKNIDPEGDDWIDQEGNIAGDDNIWAFEANGNWDWIDDNTSGFFELDADRHEPFLDFGIDQLENSSDEKEGNGQYDIGEQFFDTGIDGIFTGDEIGYCAECRQGNGLKDRIVDPDTGNELFSEYKDYGFDGCPNEIETGDLTNPCDDFFNNLYNLDLNRDDMNLDPNKDNGPEGTEDNGQYDAGEILDENIVLDAHAFVSGDFSVNLGNNLYYYELNGTENYTQPNISGYEKITLWISKIEENDEEGSYSLTISMLSQVDINSFEIQLYHANKESSLELVPNIVAKQLTPFKYQDQGDHIYTPSDGPFLEDSEKYIKDVSLHSFSPLSNTESSEDRLISYGYGMEAKLYFDGLNDFLYRNDETAFISHEQTHLFIYIDKSSDAYPIPEEGIFLKISGSIGDVLVEDFIDPIPIKINNDSDTRIKIRLGKLIDELLLQSDDLFDYNIESSHITLSIDSYMHIESIANTYYISPDIYGNFSILKLDDQNPPHIDIFYSE